MRSLLFIVAALFLCSFQTGLGFKYKNDLAQQNLKGKVKSVVEARYKAATENGKTLYVLTSKDICNYDLSGNHTEILTFDEKGNLYRKQTYCYNEHEQITEQGRYNFKDNTADITEYQYNDKGENFYWFRHDGQGNFLSKGSLYYDERGNIAESTWKDTTAVTMRETFKYDAANNPIECRTMSSDGVEKDRIVMKYDKHNNQTERWFYCQDTILFYSVVQEYDNNKNVTEQNYYNPRIGKTRSTRKYDIHGNLAAIQSYSADHPSETTYTYGYDDAGNWIKQTEFDENGQAKEMTKREIIYY
jgi:hypothetical protein